MLQCIMLILFGVILTPWAHSNDFGLALHYGQSRDFWQTVQSVQDQTGNLSGIEASVRDRFGKPDILHSSLTASYSYPQSQGGILGLDQVVIGTKAEALAGGEISNPVNPRIQAYANSTGIAFFGLKSLPQQAASFTTADIHLLAGLGPEKRLAAEGAEFIDAIPVRSGTLLLGGADFSLVDRSVMGTDFYVSTNLFLRAVYFYSTVPQAKSRTEASRLYAYRWRIQNEWTKEIETFLGKRTQIGIVSVLGQTPLPYLLLPVTWDYQQRLPLYPGLKSISGIGALGRILSPSLALSGFGGFFGGAVGGGLDLQWGSVVLSVSSFGVESLLTPAREHTRLYQGALTVLL
jgi:hypothetical protein